MPVPFRRKSTLVSAAMAAAVVAVPAFADIPVFINEIHYDNSGADANEAIEIAGPAGTDLSGWSIVLYNGANGRVYSTTTLNDVIGDAGAGYGVVAQYFPVNGVQNGAPDGIALVDAFNNPVQFISYEGSFVAVDGPAAGMTSADIGVSETGSTALGESLQLSGSGIYAENFSWQAPASQTFGLINNNQHFGDASGSNTHVVINELDADNPGTDSAEFVELYDGGVGNTALDGLSLVMYNGSNDTSYASFDLTGYRTNADGYFVLCGDAANVAGCDLDVSPDSNLIQNGADAVALYSADVSAFPNGTALTTDGLLDAVVYGTNDADDMELLALLNAGQPQLNDTQTESLQRCPNGNGMQRNTDSFAAYTPTPGGENVCVTPPADVYVHDIQGSSDSSPMVGALVRVQAVVVGDFQGSDRLNGFYIQEEDTDADNDPLTSEGVFVYAPGSVDVQPGDVVRVVGRVTEYSGLTEIGNVESVDVVSSDASVSAVNLVFPLNNVADLEAYEGMAVHIAQPMVIAEYYNYDRYGELVLASPLAGDSRPYQPTAVVAPGADAIARQQLNQLSRITLDDGTTAQNPRVLRHPNGDAFGLNNGFRGGDQVSDVVGVMDHRFGAYRIQPTAAAGYAPVNPRDDIAPTVYGDVKVASFNVLNYFTTLDENGNLCGPQLNLGCRGADNAQEFQRQRDKIIDALLSMDADVVGLLELENNASAAIEDLVSGLNAVAGDGVYAFIDTGTIGSDAIRVAMIYQPAKVKPLGSFAVLDASVDTRFVDDKNRPVLAQSFVSLLNAGRFTVAVNHLKSKGSACDDLGDVNTGDGQGNCNLTRTAAAQAEMDWLATNPTGYGDGDVLIIGDLNAYAKEDPIRAIETGADDVSGSADDFVNLVAAYQGDAAYSYVFDGQFGYLDYALASASLTDQVSGVSEWHINADEADVLDYNTDYKPAEQIALYQADAFRSSDHDPVLIGLQLQASIGDIRGFVDAAIAEGSLVGEGRFAAGKLRLFVDFLQRAERLQQHAGQRPACALLKLAQRAAGPQRPNLVSGSSAALIEAMIGRYLETHCAK